MDKTDKASGGDEATEGNAPTQADADKVAEKLDVPSENNTAAENSNEDAPIKNDESENAEAEKPKENGVEELDIPGDGKHKFSFLFGVIKNGEEKEIKVCICEDSEKQALKKSVSSLMEIAGSPENLRYKSFLKKEDA